MVLWYFNELKDWQNLWHFTSGFMLIITTFLLFKFDKVFAYLTYIIFNVQFTAFQYMEDWHTKNNSSFDLLNFGYGQAVAIIIILIIFYVRWYKKNDRQN
jgi:hypothetical protein